MPYPLVLVKKELYFLGFGILRLHIALDLFFQFGIYLQSDGRTLLIHELELHIDGELDNCNQVEGLDADGGLIQRQFDVLALAEEIFFNKGDLGAVVDLLRGMGHWSMAIVLDWVFL